MTDPRIANLRRALARETRPARRKRIKQELDRLTRSKETVVQPDDREQA